MSETPRVDRVHWNHAYLKEEAYKLERELNAAQQRIKRLEEAGDELLEWLKDGTISDSNYRLLANSWQRAKENKR